MARTIASGRLAFSQADFFESGHRKLGIAWSDLQMSMFVDGEVLSWMLVDGTFASDSSVGAGLVFFNEMPGAVGFYLVRFFPDMPGFWRIVLRHPVLGTESIFECDAVPLAPHAGGLTASFEPSPHPPWPPHPHPCHGDEHGHDHHGHDHHGHEHEGGHGHHGHHGGGHHEP